MRKQRFNSLIIQTPEGVSFSYQLAGPMQRVMALLLDKIIIIGITIALILIAGIIASILMLGGRFGQGVIGAIGGDMFMAVATAGFFIINTGYGIFLEWRWDGQTIGKRALNLRVMDAQGLKLNFFQVVLRNLMVFIDFLVPLPLPLLPVPIFIIQPLGGIVMFVSRYQQRIGDLAANTVVIQIPKPLKPDLDAVMTEKYNSFRDTPHLAARLRQLVGPQEAAIALRALIRRNRLDDSAKIELFGEMADYFKSLVTFPEEVTLGMSDERYVQNVVDVVYRD